MDIRKSVYVIRRPTPLQLSSRQSNLNSSQQVGNYEFSAHGESTSGADQGPVYTHHSAVASLKVKSGGTLLATAFCNIHGLWENSKIIKVT